MKLYLASFLETHNFGPGRVISITDGSRPDHIKCDYVFAPFVPAKDISKEYRRLQIDDPKNAGKIFVDKFTAQLESFYNDVLSKTKDTETDVESVLPFEDGDTLASWEREEFTHYRSLVAPFLEKLGYEVISK